MFVILRYDIYKYYWNHTEYIQIQQANPPNHLSVVVPSMMSGTLGFMFWIQVFSSSFRWSISSYQETIILGSHHLKFCGFHTPPLFGELRLSISCFFEHPVPLWSFLAVESPPAFTSGNCWDLHLEADETPPKKKDLQGASPVFPCHCFWACSSHPSIMGI